MSQHMFYEGTIYHKRFQPKEHKFTYSFFMLDIDISSLDTLKNRYFSNNKFNLFSFNSKDHFGKQRDFLKNVEELLKEFKLEKSSKMRFITLPRIFNFVFNPISLLLIFEDEKPKHMLAEVHNYNGGRVVYPILLEDRGNSLYRGKILKDMYVSPFFKKYGEYEFLFRYDKTNVALKIDLYEENRKKLTASFLGKALEFNENNTSKLFLRHTFLTFYVVTRTVWQAIKLYFKGIKFNKVEEVDTKRRY